MDFARSLSKTARPSVLDTRERLFVARRTASRSPHSPSEGRRRPTGTGTGTCRLVVRLGGSALRWRRPSWRRGAGHRESCCHPRTTVPAAVPALAVASVQCGKARVERCLVMAAHTGSFDVVVVGGGNAGHSAALAAAERGRRVLLLEKGPRGQHGGNSYYTAGAMRVAHSGVDEVRDLVDDDERLARTTLAPYTASEYILDMERLTNGRNDDEFTATLVADSEDTLRWLKGHGLRFRLMYERQAYQERRRRPRLLGRARDRQHRGRQGPGRAARSSGRGGRVEVRHGSAPPGCSAGRPGGRRASSMATRRRSRAGSVVLAAGGFEANAEMGAEHLGQGWERAKVRGTPHNTGDCIAPALEAGAAPCGDWSSCHASSGTPSAPRRGDRELANQLTRRLPARDRGQRRRRAVPRRGRRLPQLHLRQVRQRDPRAARAVSRTSCSTPRTRPLLRPRSTTARRHASPRPTRSRSWPGLGVDAGRSRRDGRRSTTRGRRRASVRPGRQGRPAGRAAAAEDQLGDPLERRRSTLTPSPAASRSLSAGCASTPTAACSTRRASRSRGCTSCGEMLGGLFWGNYPGGTGLGRGRRTDLAGTGCCRCRSIARTEGVDRTPRRTRSPRSPGAGGSPDVCARRTTARG